MEHGRLPKTKRMKKLVRMKKLERMKKLVRMKKLERMKKLKRMRLMGKTCSESGSMERSLTPKKKPRVWKKTTDDTTSGSVSAAHQDPTVHEVPQEPEDKVLKREATDESQILLVWRPGSPTSLCVCEDDYQPFREIVCIVHLEEHADVEEVQSLALVTSKSQMLDHEIADNDYQPPQEIVGTVEPKKHMEAEEVWSLVFVSLNWNQHHTVLSSMMTGQDTRGLLFTCRQLHQGGPGSVTFKLNFRSVMRYLRNFYETEIYLMEVIEEHEYQVTTRFLVTSRMDPTMPFLPEYDPKVRGGPWYRNPDGEDLCLKKIKTYDHKHPDEGLPHNLEFFFKLTDDQYHQLHQMSSLE
ncbi:uncharacterized protein LOC121874577 isoform X1 [Homarus americanus]|uniref:uncharacterized protein LOC121874577 isoform X1 n=2 Tax=Homarus americanus TaxID=6706 RepID=UPI001C454784|nr:uncharacterized protein LOC121874577 isoform X1 [Homarus americanus]XP_042234710.1 uncharacterized protein LOC121874577 isoform X1 [Homarus americanus]